jgi:hypothetical protein
VRDFQEAQDVDVVRNEYKKEIASGHPSPETKATRNASSSRPTTRSESCKFQNKDRQVTGIIERNKVTWQ